MHSFNKLSLFAIILALLLSSTSLAKPYLESHPIADKESLIFFVRDCVEARYPAFIVNYVHGYLASNDDILYSCNLPHIYSKVLNKNGHSTKVLYKLTYYPGMKVADAYLNKDFSKLSPREYQLYQIARGIVEEARGMSPLRAELFFHDTICRQVSYFTQKAVAGIPNHATAVGALLEGRANCQGYCDAFYMLCSMFGLKVDMQSGYTGKQRHVWNLVEINKKWYAVDVTWDDNDKTINKEIEFISHKYFNAPEEIMKTTHRWDEDNETEQIEKRLDSAYYYLTDQVDDYTFGYYFTSIHDAIDFISLQLIKNKKSVKIMSRRAGNRYDDIKFVNLLIDSTLLRARKGISYYNISQQHGSFVYYTILVKQNSVQRQNKRKSFYR